MSIVGKPCPKPFQAMCCAYHAEEADNAFAAIQRVRELHAYTEQPDPNDIYGAKILRICDACDEPVPCPTIAALDGNQ